METLKDFLARYEIDQTHSLDQKNFGSVYKGINRADDAVCAIKTIETHPKFDQNLFLERYTKAQELHHDNLLPYHAAHRFVDGMVTNVVVMPLLSRGSLDRHWDLTTEQKKLISDQILDGLYYLHQHGLVWQNLSARHILLDEDFGNDIPKFINYGNTRKIPLAFFADYEYLAPEQFDANAPLDVRSDIWAYGVLLYYLWAGRLPFGEKSASLPNSKIQERILGTWEPGLLSKIPEPYQTIVEKCLKRKKEARWEDCGEIIVVIKNWQAPITVVPSEEEQEAATANRKILRRPNRPVLWWQVVLLFLLAAVLGSLLG